MLPYAKKIKEEYIPEDLKKQKTITPFAIINNLYVIKNKELLYAQALFDEKMSFLINRLVASDINSINLAYFMSKCYDMPLKNVLMFYFYTIKRKKKHNIPYFNKSDRTLKHNIDNVCKLFKCNKAKAQEYLYILSDEQIKEVKDRVEAESQIVTIEDEDNNGNTTG